MENYVIDLETSGIVAGKNEIFQISIIRCTDRHQLSRRIKIERPDVVSKESLRITNKTLEDLLIGMPKREAVEEVERFLAQDGKTSEFRCFIGHSVNFDQRFCQALWKELDIPLPFNYTLCTKELTRGFLKKMGIQKPTLNLAASLEQTGTHPAPGQAHDAIKDCQDCFLLWKKLIEEGVDYLPKIKRVS